MFITPHNDVDEHLPRRPESCQGIFAEPDYAIPSSALCFISVFGTSTFTAFLGVFRLKLILLRIQSCRSEALIKAVAFLRIWHNSHSAIDKLKKSYKRLIFQPSPLLTAAIHRPSFKNNTLRHICAQIIVLNPKIILCGLESQY
jgi:hypothetical protein